MICGSCQSNHIQQWLDYPSTKLNLTPLVYLWLSVILWATTQRYGLSGVITLFRHWILSMDKSYQPHKCYLAPPLVPKASGCSLHYIQLSSPSCVCPVLHQKRQWPCQTDTLQGNLEEQQRCHHSLRNCPSEQLDTLLACLPVYAGMWRENQAPALVQC